MSAPADVLAGMTVRTWADGFGAWHARVTVSYGVDAGTMREAARAAILAELSLRGEAGADYRPALRWVESPARDGDVLVAVFVEDEPHGVPASHPVRVLDVDEPAADRVTCGCGRSWDDAVTTNYTPAPSPRCPFEAWHEDDEGEPDACDRCGTAGRVFLGRSPEWEALCGPCVDEAGDIAP